MRKSLLSCLLITTLFLTGSVLAAPPQEEIAPALRLVRAADLVEAEFRTLRINFSGGASPLVLDLLLKEDSTLYEDFEIQYAKHFAQALEAGQLNDLADFFEGPIGRAFLTAQGKVLGNLDLLLNEAVAPHGLPAEDPRLRLQSRLEATWPIAEALANQLTPKELEGTLRFLDGPLGTAWLQATAEVQEGVLRSMAADSPSRRAAVLGCTLPLAMPQVEQALLMAGRSENPTPSDLAPLVPGILQTQEICDCVFGKMIARSGGELLLQVFEGVEEAILEFGEIFSSGVCLPEGTGELLPSGQLAQAVRDVRTVGDAMMAWLIDLADPDKGSMNFESPFPPIGGSWSIRRDETSEPLVFTRIDADDLERILVPEYLAELPRIDPWGTPYEFAVNTNLLVSSVISLRSAGADGRFDEQPYTAGSFPMEAGDFRHDIVWRDGFFARWPEAGD